MAAGPSPTEQVRAFVQWQHAGISGPRERLQATAFERFYSDGIRATGIDVVINGAGVAKASFYRHFRSKNELVSVYLQQRADAWLAWLRSDVDRRAKDPVGSLLAVFDALEELFSDAEYRGCAVINAVCEVGHESAEVMQVASRAKEQVHAYVVELAQRATITEGAAELADAFLVLIDGAFCVAQRTGLAKSARTARQVAATLVEQALLR